MITLQAVLQLKDDFTDKAKGAGEAINGALEKAVSVTKAIGEGLKGGFELLTGHYDELGKMLHSIPGPVGEIAGAVGDFLGSAIQKTVDLAGATAQLQRNTGMTAEEASKLIAVDKSMGIEADTTISLFGKFAKTLGGAMDAEGNFANSGKGLAKVLSDMGIEATGLDGKVKPINDLLPEIADKFKQLGPGAEASALAVKLFGREGLALLPVLLQGSEGLAKMGEKAQELGTVLNQSTIDSMKNLKQAQRDIGESFDAISIKVGTAVLPAVANLTTGFNAYLENVGKIQQGNNIFETGWNALGNAVNFLTGNLKPAAATMKDTTGATQDLGNAAEDAAKKNMDAASAAKASAEAAKAQAEAEKALKESISNVESALTGVSSAMSKAQLAQEAYKLATGQTTLAAFEQKQGAEALMNAYMANKLTLTQLTQAEVELAHGNITAQQALQMSGDAAKQNKADMNTLEAAVNGVSSAVRTLPKDPTVTVHGRVDPSAAAAAAQYNNIHDKTVTVTVNYSVPAGQVNIPGGGRCFVAGTMVDVPQGTYEIELLKVGDQVWAYDHERGRAGLALITRVFTHHAPATVIVDILNGAPIKCTPEHSFWCVGKAAYVPANELRPDDLLVNVNGATIAVASVTPAGEADVYNIEVEGTHNYYAGGVLVHNDSILHQPIGGGVANNITFSNSFTDAMGAARNAARMIQQAQSNATRQALTRAAMGY